MNKVKYYLKTRHPQLFLKLKAVYRFFVKTPHSDTTIAATPVATVNTTVLPQWNGKNAMIDSRTPWSNRVNKVLIIGRIREGDSIASNTNAFLNAVDYSACDIFLFDEYTRTLFLCKNRNNFEFVKQCYAPDLDPRFFDVLIYANVLDNCEETYPFRYRVPTDPPFLSFAYPVFDGTVPPKEWIDSINTYFDAIIVPCNNLKNIFESAGVTKPVFELPIALNLKPFFNSCSFPHTDEEYNFGWIGTFEDRKNPIKIIEAFTAAFGDNEKVKLHMHTRFIDNGTEAGKRFKQLKANLPANIIITEGVKSDQEIIDMLSSWDTYVYVSQGEGYSITPRQALACGLSLILSAIPTHVDITTLDERTGVFWIPANKEIDAVQPSMNHRVCGKMFDIETTVLISTLKRVYVERNRINCAGNVAIRQKAMDVFDISNQNFNYMQLVLPNQVRMADENRICDDAIATNDRDLFLKYKYFIRNEKRNIVICPVHDGGFCSVFNKWMSHLVYMPQNTILIPDWRIKTLRTYVMSTFNRRDFTSFCYGTEADGNIFFKCFCNPYEGLIDEDILNSSLMYQYADKILDAGNFNQANEPNLTYINSYNLYEDPEYFPEFRKKYNHYYRKYVKFVPELQKKIDEFCEEHLKDKFVISAHIRSAAQQSELIEGDKPTWDLYEKHIERILEENKIDRASDDWRLFIASDNSQSIAHFKGIYGKKVVFQEMNRLSEKDDLEYQEAAKKAGKNIEGFGIQHRAARDESKWTIRNAYEILFDVTILAKGDYFIFVNSNISTMVSYVNPEIQMVYCR